MSDEAARRGVTPLQPESIRAAAPGPPERLRWPAGALPMLGALRWVDDAIEIVDQTLLPGRVELIRLRSVDDAVGAIRRLAIRGAPAIGLCGAFAVVLGLDEARPSSVEGARVLLDGLADRIGGARPTAVNLPWAVRRVRDAARSGTTPEEVRRLALAEAWRIHDEDVEACRRIGEHGRSELAGVDSILTHCNAGRLATAGSGTALAIVYAKIAHGDDIRVFACEARPLLQGARLTTWELLDAGVDVTLIPDGAAAPLLASGRVGAVVTGADRIAANGDTANKIGTLGIALAARRAGVPFYVAAPHSTFDPATPTGDGIVIEERPADEVRSFAGIPSAPADVAVWNPAFDVTPHDLITAFITDRGVVRAPFDSAIVRLGTAA